MPIPGFGLRLSPRDRTGGPPATEPDRKSARPAARRERKAANDDQKRPGKSREDETPPQAPRARNPAAAAAESAARCRSASPIGDSCSACGA